MHGEWLTQLPAATILPRVMRADAIIGCSDYLTGLVSGRFKQVASRCRTIFNGVNTSEFCPAAKAAGEAVEVSDAPPPQTVLYVGRISPEKGLHVLIEAFTKVHSQRPEARLKIIGPPWVLPRQFLVDLSQEQDVRELARFYGRDYLQQLKDMVPQDMKSCVTFAGMVKHDELPRQYRDAAVLVNPSLSETFGMSLIEAMACKTPVIATAVGGMPQVVSGDCGLLVPSNDAASLAEAILSVLSHPGANATVERARNRTVEEFSWYAIAQDTLSLYMELSQRNAKIAA